MMRVMGKVAVASVVLSLAAVQVKATTTLIPSHKQQALVNQLAFDSTPWGGPVPINPRAAYNEDFEGWADGQIATQIGTPPPGSGVWSANDGVNNGPPANQSGFAVTSAYSSNGYDGHGGSKSLFVDDTTRLTPFQTCAAAGLGRTRTPTNLDSTLLTAGVDIYINDNGGADYYFSQQNNAVAPVIQSRAVFVNDPTGAGGTTMAILDRNAANALVFYDTFASIGTGRWLPGQWYTLQVLLEFPNPGQYSVYLGTSKNGLITPANLVWIAGPGGTAGTAPTPVGASPSSTNHLLLGDSGCEAYGIPADPNINGGKVGAYWDNLQNKATIPEPGTLAMLGAGALLAIRRRRSR